MLGVVRTYPLGALYTSHLAYANIKRFLCGFSAKVVAIIHKLRSHFV